MKKDTRLVTAGRKPEENFGIVNPPVYHASTVTFPTVAAMEKAKETRFESVFYGRYGTPTTFAFEEAVAALEGGEKTIAVPSGMAAIAGPLLALLKTGDHVLMLDNVYHPTRNFCDGPLADFGVETTYYDPMIGSGIADLMRPRTKVVFVEAPGSLTFEVQDIPAIAEEAHKAGATVIMDNTWSAGYFFQPFEHGVDISVQAATKYIVGHSDAMLGVITTNRELFPVIKARTVEVGYSAAPDDCYLGLRGLRSLAARLARQQETGLKVAHWLEGRPEVAEVRHPAFESCPGHEIWKRDFTGSSSLFGVLLKDYSKKAVAAMLDGLELHAMGASWGGFESLILPIDPSSTRTASRWGHAGPSLRIHCGLEDADDLIADLASGLERLTAEG
jgi:cysteine-S-conjugate beta-lyase